MDKPSGPNLPKHYPEPYLEQSGRVSPCPYMTHPAPLCNLRGSRLSPGGRNFDRFCPRFRLKASGRLRRPFGPRTETAENPAAGAEPRSAEIAYRPGVTGGRPASGTLAQTTRTLVRVAAILILPNTNIWGDVGRSGNTGIPHFADVQLYPKSRTSVKWRHDHGQVRYQT